MFNKIMVPLDGSSLAERALPYAERLAGATGATIHLVAVVEVLANAAWAPMPVYLSAADLEAAIGRATAYVETQQQRLKHAGVESEVVQLTGSPAATLLEYERSAGTDLTVMCSHGRSGLKRLVLGSVAGELIQLGDTPILLIPAEGNAEVHDHALVPLDGSRRAEAALHVLNGLVPGVVREATLLHVIHPPEQLAEGEEYLASVSLRIQRPDLAVHTRVEQGNAIEQIIAAIGNDKLAVMTTHGRSALTRWALGSVAERVARGATAPVLLVRKGGGA
jgi:nucleotide-binding universal stress UspA family protein